jgi:transposase
MVTASERDETARQQWREAVAELPTEHLVFVDESSTTIALTRRYGWAPHDQRAVGQVPRNYGKNTTFVAALRRQGLQAPWALEGAMDTVAFARYVAEVLAPTLSARDIVVLDHLSVHKAALIQELLASRGCRLLFLPSYSPDVNPIELAFSKIKAPLRKLGSRTREALLDALASALDTITLADISGWFSHAGYASSAPSP